MARVVFFLALIIAAASAFVAPSNQAVSRTAFQRSTFEAPQMMDASAVSSIAENSQVIASSVNDFYGYFFPIAGLGFLAAFILYLSPPLKDE